MYIFNIPTLHAVQSLPWISHQFRVTYISRWAWAAVSAVEQQWLSGQGCVILHWVCDVFNLQNLNQQCWSLELESSPGLFQRDRERESTRKVREGSSFLTMETSVQVCEWRWMNWKEISESVSFSSQSRVHLTPPTPPQRRVNSFCAASEILVMANA